MNEPEKKNPAGLSASRVLENFDDLLDLELPACLLG
jgi:hypothetical protein